MNILMIGCVADFVSAGVYLFRHKIFSSDMFHKWQIDILYYYGTRRLCHCPKFSESLPWTKSFLVGTTSNHFSCRAFETYFKQPTVFFQLLVVWDT